MSEEPGLSNKKKKSMTKSFTKKPDLEAIQEMVDTQGLAKSTRDKRTNVERQFNTWAKKFEYKNLDELCQTPKEEIDATICAFFDSYTVGKDNELP